MRLDPAVLGIVGDPRREPGAGCGSPLLSSTHNIAVAYWLQCRRPTPAELEELAPYSARGESSGVHIDIEVGRRAPEAFEQDRIDAPHAPG